MLYDHETNQRNPKGNTTRKVSKIRMKDHRKDKRKREKKITGLKGKTRTVTECKIKKRKSKRQKRQKPYRKSGDSLDQKQKSQNGIENSGPERERERRKITIGERRERRNR